MKDSRLYAFCLWDEEKYDKVLVGVELVSRWML